MKDLLNVEFSEDGTVLVRAPKELYGGYVIPESVTTIGANAFSGCICLNALTIPRSVKQVLADAFLDCDSLTTILFEGDLLDWLGIRWCSGIECGHRLYFKDDVSYRLVTSVVIPDSVTEIPDFCFYSCKDLTGVVFHDAVKSVSINAFSKSDVAGDSTLNSLLAKSVSDIPDGSPAGESKAKRDSQKKRITVLQIIGGIVIVGLTIVLILI